MMQLAALLAQRVGRTVINGTGLEGNWSFDLAFAPEFASPPQTPPATSNAPSLFTALQEQLGLKLDARKGPIDVLVIDSVNRPTED